MRLCWLPLLKSLLGILSRPPAFLSFSLINSLRTTFTVGAFIEKVVSGSTLDDGIFCHAVIGHFRNVRGLGKSMVVFLFFEKLRYSNERSTKFESLNHE